MSDATEQIAENLRIVRQQIADAASASERTADEIQLVAVTKYVGPKLAAALVDAGCSTLGESRPQQLWEKADALKGTQVQWHLIGHLQRNKVRRTLPLISMMHSGDSMRLLRAVDSAAGDLNLAPVPLLIEVNVSGDAEKHGFAAADVESQLETISEMPHVRIRGLMCMAHREGGPETARRDFATLRKLRDTLAASCPDTISLMELSMGMSGDFAEAIAEGATIVRVGSALFSGVPRS